MRAKILVSRVAIFVAILALWEIVPYYRILNPLFVSPLVKVVEALPQVVRANNAQIPGGILYNFGYTMFEISVALALSIAIGLTIGFLIGYYRIVADTYEPFVYLLHALPVIIIYPILYLTVGVGYESKILLGLFLGVFPMIINTAAGLRQTKESHVNMAKSLGANRLQIMTRVLIPSAAPSIMSGVRLSLGSVTVGVILGEILVARRGLGVIVTNTSQYLSQVPEMYDVIILIVVIAYTLYILIAQVEKKLIPYESR